LEAVQNEADIGKENRYGRWELQWNEHVFYYGTAEKKRRRISLIIKVTSSIGSAGYSAG
jgi:hypothetical protein